MSIIKKTKPNGLYYIKDIITNEDELIKQIDELEWFPLSQSKFSRKVQHYGYKYNYVTFNIYEKTTKLPKFLKPLQKELTNICKELELINEDEKFNQCIINNYEAGQGISKHIDKTAYGSVIGCYILGSGSSIIFRNKDKVKEKYIDSKMLYIMSSDARYKWTHEIPNRKNDIYKDDKIPRGRRISITFRIVPKINLS